MRFQNRSGRFTAAVLLTSVLLGLYATLCPAETRPSLTEIRAAIKAKGADWIAGPTAVSDVPLEQLTGAQLEHDREMYEKALPSSIFEDANLDAPAQFDWRNYNGQDWTTPIRNQNPCGSCYLFASAAATEGAMKVQAGTYGYLANPDLAEQFMLSCNAAFTCTEDTLYNALDYLRDTGTTDETCFPYTATDATACGNRCSNWSDRIYQIQSWGNVTATTADIKTAIQTYGPIPTAMRVYSDFNNYRGGVYENVTGGNWALHYVTLVGWIDSDQCWIAKNSWGTDWGETINFQPTTPGATNGGWFRIKWGNSWVGNDVRYVVAGMANLTDYPHSGWTYSLVPRNTTGTAWSSCPLPATLNGNQNNTYLNFAGINNGSEPAPPFGAYWYLDDVYAGGVSWGKIVAGGAFYAPDRGPVSVRGGRHTVRFDLDVFDQVWETNESDYNNKFTRQFVWSPYALYDESPVTRNAPPKKDAYGYTSYNNDGFSFLVQYESTNKWWSAVGIIPSSSSADYDLYLWDIGDYGGSTQGFGAGAIEISNRSSAASDFVMVNDNMTASGTYYAGAINYNHGSGDFRIEEDTSEYIYARPGTTWNGPYSKASTNVLDIYEINLGPGDYYVYLDQTAGSCDLGMSLYDDETLTAHMSEYMTGGYANSNGDGADESFDISISDAGWYGLVVWKSDSSDYNKSHTYRVAVGQPAITVTVPNGGETWNAWTWQWITWDPFGYLGDYVNIQISRDGGYSWSTIPGAGTQVNDGSYQWYVSPPGSAQCRIRIASTSHGTYTDISNANFTIIYDSTPPTPNPMIWSIEPYERDTSVISMVAATASDTTTPISYFFDFYNNPTGGSGGTDSGWRSSVTYTDSGLSANHQYGYRVKAKDGNNNETAYSTPVSYDFTDIETPTGITFATISSSSIQARSTNTPSNLYRANSGLVIENATKGTNSGWKHDNAYWTSSALLPNTQYGFRAKARNGEADETSYCGTYYRYTRAVAPGAAAFSSTTASSIQANWAPNGNPTGTQYFCENTTTGATSGWISNTSWNSTGLSPNTSYAFRVMAKNAEGNLTGWTNLGSANTLSGVVPCEGDFEPDGDVDGSDMAACAADPGAVDLGVFATNFGRTDCPH